MRISDWSSDVCSSDLIDHGSVFVNVDLEWFAAQDLKAPQRLADLTKPAYKDLFVIPGASTSTPGMAFLLATIAEYGDQWPAYWKKLMANGAKLDRKSTRLNSSH